MKYFKNNSNSIIKICGVEFLPSKITPVNLSSNLENIILDSYSSHITYLGELPKTRMKSILDHKTVLVFGSSPILDNINLSSLISSEYIKVGINNFYKHYYTDIIAFSDKVMVDYLEKFPPCSEALLLTLMRYDTKNINALKDKYNITGRFNYSTKELPYFSFTHDLVLNWCVLNNITNVVLIGTADFTTKNKYKSTEKFTPDQTLVDLSIEKINNYYSNKLNMYTINKRSLLSINKISIKDIFQLCV